MNRVPAPTEPSLRRAYRAFKTATDFAVYDRTTGLIEGPYAASGALERRQAARLESRDVAIVARYAAQDGTFGWFDILGEPIGITQEGAA